MTSPNKWQETECQFHITAGNRMLVSHYCRELNASFILLQGSEFWFHITAGN